MTKPFENTALCELCKWNEPMSNHTSLRVGGCAKVLFTPKKIADLVLLIKLNAQLKQPLEFYFLGLGSNLLVRDGGFDGVIVATKYLKNIEFINDEKPMLWAQTGTGLAKLAQASHKLGYDNLNFLVGIPGSVGGALMMNAGCHQSETWDYVEKVEWLDANGKIIVFDAGDFEIGYREAKLKSKHKEKELNNGIFYRALFRLDQVNSKPLSFFVQWRKEHQPIDKPNCGSVFKNPKTDNPNLYSAGFYIEQAGLKGYAIGKGDYQAEVSTKHANFIVVKQGAKASDVENLIKHIQKAVYEKFGIMLVLELQLIGKNES